MSSRWYVVLTKWSAEAAAGRNISAKGFRIYLPTRIVQVRHAGRKVRRERALYQRYLFVSTEHSGLRSGWINFAVGVASRGLLCDAALKPQTISDEIIQGVRRHEAALKAESGEWRSGFKPGDKFTIPIGQFANFEASYIGEEHGEVFVIVHLFSRPNVVRLPVAELPSAPNFSE